MFTSSMDAITYTPSNESYILMTSKYMNFFKKNTGSDSLVAINLSHRCQIVRSLPLHKI